MREPLQALLIAPDNDARTAILEGRKTITIREGHRDYKVGQPVMLCCHLVPWCVMADVTSVRHCLLAEVTEEELNADGFEDRADMLRGMRQYYPNLDTDSPITIVRWEKVRGRLVGDLKFTKEFENRLNGSGMYP